MDSEIWYYMKSIGGTVEYSNFTSKLTLMYI